MKRVKPARLHVTEDVSKGVLDREFNETFEVHWEGALKLDQEEVAGVRWISLANLHEEVKEHPNNFTTWFLADYALLLSNRT